MADQKDISAAPAAPAGQASGGTQSFGGDRPSRGYSDGGRGRGPRRSSRDQRDNDEPKDGLIEKVIHINRSSKVVKGGRRFSFSALIVMGDKQGRVGMGMGKGAEVSEAIKKGGENARSHVTAVSLASSTIPHEVYSEFGGAKVLLRPASPGTGLICGKIQEFLQRGQSHSECTVEPAHSGADPEGAWFGKPPHRDQDCLIL